MMKHASLKRLLRDSISSKRLIKTLSWIASSLLLKTSIARPNTASATWPVRKRVPFSVALCSSAFASQAAYQARALGLAAPERHIVLAAHPISDATPEELAAKADALYADLVGELAAAGPSTEEAAVPVGKDAPPARRAAASFRGRRIVPSDDEVLSAECAAGA